MYDAAMSKRAQEVKRNLAQSEAAWATAHPGQEPGPVESSRLTAMAWDHERPAKPKLPMFSVVWFRVRQWLIDVRADATVGLTSVVSVVPRGACRAGTIQAASTRCPP